MNKDALESKIQERAKNLGSGQPYNLSISAPAPALPERAGVLPERLQTLAREYIGARHKSGQAFLDACRWLSEARTEAKHGEWQIFLEATNTSAATAKRMLDTHTTAMRDQQFADAVRTDWIGATMAGALAQPSISDETRAEMLHRDVPPKLADMPRAARKTTRMVDFDQPMLPDMPAPALPTDLPLEFAVIQRRLNAHGITLLSNIQGHHRAFVTRREGMTGVVTFDWADVLSKLERLEGQDAPAGDPLPPKLLALALSDLDATLPQSLSDLGFYWKAAQPPTIAHNDGWYTTAETVEAALNLAHDRAQEKVEAKDRRLSPAAHASALALLISIRTDLITDQIGSAERHTRQLLSIIEQGEAED